ncbi:MAG: alpha-galactosidase, partial [Candidatus Omnitrophica bacterium]|nr:alpha-galactosidase [Candidatus Omnitrophota bacterium]
NGYTESNQIAFARLYKKSGLDFETFWVDAGWFEGGWPHGVGNWFPRKDAFPDGFRNLSKVVHDLGMNFLVWFEPERVAAGTWLEREHRDWLLAVPEGARIYCPDASVRNYLLNLGNPEARAWLTDHVSKMIEEGGIDIYRHDANIDPLDFWPLADAPDRQGMTEIRHIEGLYAYWEELKTRHPGLVVECCCSGNRRFDLESISRTINLWRSDYVFHPTEDQCQTYGISFYVQLHANGCNTVDKYWFRSMLAPGMCLCWDPRAPDFPLEQAREDIALFKRARPYFSGDYYPLTPYSTKDNVWFAYEFYRPDLDAGVVLAFRRPACASTETVLRLGGLQPDARYEVENLDTGGTERNEGTKLALGLRVQVQEKPGSVVLFFRKVE